MSAITTCSSDQAVYDVIDDVLSGNNYDDVLPRKNEDNEMSDMSNASTEPVNHASYNNAIQLHDELTSSNQASDNRKVMDNQAAYEVPVDMPSSGQNDDYIEIIPREADNTEIPDMNSPSTEPVDVASISNKTQLHEELASSIQTSDYRPAGSEEQPAYEVPVDMPSSDQNENYTDVISYEDDNKEMNNQTTELVDQASFSNKTQLHSGKESDEQEAYEVPVDIPSSGQNDIFHNVPPSKDDKYEKNTGDPRYQPLELSRQTLYQELYEKMA